MPSPERQLAVEFVPLPLGEGRGKGQDGLRSEAPPQPARTSVGFASLRGTPVLIKNVADVHIGPELRRGIVDWNGEGETVGGIIIMRFGGNALATIEAVKEKLEDLKQGLPEGVTIRTAYDRSSLIERAIDNLKDKLLEESIIVALVTLIFLLHFRSALVAIITLPLGILVAFLIMYFQGLNANIMSLGGIAITIGTMVDGAIVMVENAHKHLASAVEKKGSALSVEERWETIAAAAREVGPALFFSLLVITVPLELKTST